MAVPVIGTTWEVVDRMGGRILRTMESIGGEVPSKRLSALCSVQDGESVSLYKIYRMVSGKNGVTLTHSFPLYVGDLLLSRRR